MKTACYLAIFVVICITLNEKLHLNQGFKLSISQNHLQKLLINNEVYLLQWIRESCRPAVNFHHQKNLLCFSESNFVWQPQTCSVFREPVNNCTLTFKVVLGQTDKIIIIIIIPFSYAVLFVFYSAMYGERTL